MVLHVIEGLGTGGAEQQLSKFLLRSDRQRFGHEVCTLAQEGRFADGLREAGIPVHFLSGRDDGDFARLILRFLRLVRRVDPDIIHATLYRPAVASRVVGRLCRKPVVTTLVSTPYEREWRLSNPRLTDLKVWRARTVDRLTARLGTRFVAITESVKASAVLQLGIPIGRISVIPRGLAFEENLARSMHDIAAARKALGWTDEYPLIINVGRLFPAKGQEYAIRAMPRIVSKFPAARMVIAGEGPLRSELERLIRSQGMDSHVTLLGERGDVDLLLRVADIFVFPSLYEGLGNALLEAMMAGKPCVVSRIQTLCEVTGNGRVALLADLRSPEDIAAKLLEIAEDRALGEKLGSTARTWVQSRYNVSRSVAALEELFAQVVSATERSAASSAISRQPNVPWGASTLLAAARALDASREGVLRVLVYHRICNPTHGLRGTPHVVSATPTAFEDQVSYIARHYVPITAHDAAAALLEKAPLPRRAVLLTFDDGYRDFLTDAWPILKHYGVPALLFVPTAYPGTSRGFWWDELFEMVCRAEVPSIQVFGLRTLPLRTPEEQWIAYRRLHDFVRFLPPGELSARLLELRQSLGTPELESRAMLTWDELRFLASEGLAVGSHTRTHAAMPYLTEEQLVDELRSAHVDLERELGRAAPLFSYPFGLADPRAVPTLRDLGYVAAFMSLPGRNFIGRRDPFLLFRHSLHVQQPFVRFAMSLTTAYVGARERGRAVKAYFRQGGAGVRAVGKAYVARR